MKNHVLDLLGRWREFAKMFVGKDGAIIAHTGDCLYFKMLTKGFRARDSECTCKAFKAAEALLGLVRDTTGEIDRLEHADLPIYAAPCAECRCGSLCHWDDENTPGSGVTAEEWAPVAAGALIECQRCPCQGYRRVESKRT